MGGTFFISWELWQQMTFVLACAICVVIFAGLCKLTWQSRYMKKQEVLDEEKRARLLEMRKTGLQTKRTGDIPFGVRATQAGIEIEGIWVSRPSTPNPNASSTALNNPASIGVTPNPLAKNKSLDPKSAAGPGRIRMPSGYISPAARSPTSPGHLDGPPDLSRNKSTHQRSDSGLNSDALRMLEGKPPHQPTNNATYVPRSSAPDTRQRSKSQPRQQGRSHSRQRGSDSSNDDGYGAETPSPTRGQYMYAASAGPSRNASAVNLSSYAATSSGHPTIPNFPLSSPEREPWNSGYAASETQLPLLSNADAISMPEPTFGPGEAHYSNKPRPGLQKR
ncbi:hypothetical protein MCOR25_004771 [Pyricularia grisea]|uniref:Uncharacterized protein n=1 Tax=Pyricularia grisea TaxID=148305 RepID=A0A6P8BBE6_PYRGI|nr:uncharacterized protein PgNI_04686 [Pyricularia grisea]KAI6367980.1 hypothetical protein MCOR25_004771 [Pyricularia grisea]TLD13161.1 hypothetical protein PgNI_04686 [Pyricularia grisea]